MMDRKKGLKSLAKKMGDGGMYMLSEQQPLEIVSTGVTTFDAALGTGGFVRGSQNAIYGMQSAGKSSLVYTAIANLQKSDPESMACIIDVEQSVRVEYLEMFGIDCERLVVIQEPTIGEYMNDFRDVVRDHAIFDYIVIDSVGALMRSAEVEGDATTGNVGGTSREITRWVGMVNSELTRINKLTIAGEEVIRPIVVWINQVRDVIGARVPMQSMPGGHALHHMMSTITRLRVSNAAGDKVMGTLANGVKGQVGNRVIATVEKNKFAPPRKQAGYSFIYEECPEYPFGVDSVDACLSLAVERGVIEAKGPWFYHGDRKWQGRNSVLDALHSDSVLYHAIYTETMDTYRDEVDVHQ